MIKRRVLVTVSWRGRGQRDGSRREADHPGPGPSGWDSVPSDDQAYDPSATPASRDWYGDAGGPQGDPYRYDRPDAVPSYRPPPPTYVQVPPPVYANPYVYPYPYHRPPNPTNAVIAGVLMIVSGGLAILWMVTFTGIAGEFIPSEWLVCLVLPIILSLVSVVGGIMAILKRMWPLALLGAICSMMNFGAWGLNILLGLAAIVLVIISKDAFDANDPRPGGPFRY